MLFNRKRNEYIKVRKHKDEATSRQMRAPKAQKKEDIADHAKKFFCQWKIKNWIN